MKSFKFLLLIFMVAGGVYFCNHKEEPKNEPVSSPTKLQVYNGSKDSVLVYLTLGATPGCLQNVLEVPFIQDTVSGQRSLQGTFWLKPGDSTITYSPNNAGFNGVLSFNFAPDNCPSASYPNGINQFEFIINNGFQGPNAQESINISCVHGVNCIIRADVVSDFPFNAGPGYNNIEGFSNRLNKNAIGLVGVYPYGCDTCTGSKTPPSCILLPQPAQKQSICQIQRNANKTGGIIKIVYLAKEEPLN